MSAPSSPRTRGLALTAALTLFAAFPAARARAESPEALVARATQLNGLGFDNGQARVRMVLQDAAGTRKERVIMARSMKEAGLTRTVIRFLSPAEVQGSAFLLLERAGAEADDMHLYLPALKRTRRIAGNQKDGAFMGSDFSYADMENRDIKAATYEAKPDTSIDGVECHVIVARPTPGDGAQPYGRIEMAIRKDNALIQQSKFFDKDDALVKVYKLNEFKTIDGRLLTTKSQMWTKKEGHTTFLFIDEVDTKTPVNPGEFTPDALSKG